MHYSTKYIIVGESVGMYLLAANLVLTKWIWI
jgi:hypothetical protein